MGAREPERKTCTMTQWIGLNLLVNSSVFCTVSPLSKYFHSVTQIIWRVIEVKIN